MVQISENLAFHLEEFLIQLCNSASEMDSPERLSGERVRLLQPPSQKQIKDILQMSHAGVCKNISSQCLRRRAFKTCSVSTILTRICAIVPLTTMWKVLAKLTTAYFIALNTMARFESGRMEMHYRCEEMARTKFQSYARGLSLVGRRP